MVIYFCNIIILYIKFFKYIFLLLLRCLYVNRFDILRRKYKNIIYILLITLFILTVYPIFKINEFNNKIYNFYNL